MFQRQARRALTVGVMLKIDARIIHVYWIKPRRFGQATSIKVHSIPNFPISSRRPFHLIIPDPNRPAWRARELRPTSNEVLFVTKVDRRRSTRSWTGYDERGVSAELMAVAIRFQCIPRCEANFRCDRRRGDGRQRSAFSKTGADRIPTAATATRGHSALPSDLKMNKFARHARRPPRQMEWFPCN